MATTSSTVYITPYPLTNLSVTDGVSTITVGDGITDTGSSYTFTCGSAETLPCTTLTFSADDWVSFAFDCYTDTVHNVTFEKPTYLYGWVIENEASVEDGNGNSVTIMYTATESPEVITGGFSTLYDSTGTVYGESASDLTSWVLTKNDVSLSDTYVDTMSSSTITLIASAPVSGTKD